MLGSSWKWGRNARLGTGRGQSDLSKWLCRREGQAVKKEGRAGGNDKGNTGLAQLTKLFPYLL